MKRPSNQGGAVWPGFGPGRRMRRAIAVATAVDVQDGQFLFRTERGGLITVRCGKPLMATAFEALQAAAMEARQARRDAADARRATEDDLRTATEKAAGGAPSVGAVAREVRVRELTESIRSHVWGDGAPAVRIIRARGGPDESASGGTT